MARRSITTRSRAFLSLAACSAANIRSSSASVAISPGASLAKCFITPRAAVSSGCSDFSLIVDLSSIRISIKLIFPDVIRHARRHHAGQFATVLSHGPSDTGCRHVCHNSVGDEDSLPFTTANNLRRPLLIEASKIRNAGCQLGPDVSRGQLVSRTTHDDVISQAEQSVTFAPGWDLGPRVCSHDEKQIGRLVQLRLEMRQRVDRVTSSGGIEFKGRDQESRLVLGGQCEHCITLQCRSDVEQKLVRRHLGEDEQKLINFKEPGNLSGYFKVSKMNWIKGAAVKSNTLFAHWHNSQGQNRLSVFALSDSLGPIPMSG